MGLVFPVPAEETASSKMLRSVRNDRKYRTGCHKCWLAIGKGDPISMSSRARVQHEMLRRRPGIHPIRN